MKHWRIDYTIEYINGRKEENEARLEARSITNALELAIANITNPLRTVPEVSRVVIWDVGIIEDDVFPEEGEPYGD